MGPGTGPRKVRFGGWAVFVEWACYDVARLFLMGGDP